MIGSSLAITYLASPIARAEEPRPDPTSAHPDSILVPVPRVSERSPVSRSLRASWVRSLGGSTSSAALTLEHPLVPRGGTPGSGLHYYPSGGVRTADGLALSKEQAFLYGVRKFELNRGQTALKGADVAGSVGLFAGAMASSFGWLSESQALWLAGGAAALGAAYGAAIGYESTAWREEWRWPKALQEERGVHIRVRPD